HDHGATHRIDYRCELDQHPVARRLDDAPLVLGYKRVDQFAPVTLKSGERPFLVGPHEARIGGNVGAKDCRQPPLNALFHHCGLSVEMDSLTPLVEGVTTLAPAIRPLLQSSLYAPPGEPRHSGLASGALRAP